MSNGKEAALLARVAALEVTMRQLLSVLERHLMDQCAEQSNLERYKNEIKRIRRFLNGNGM